jgi:cobalamin biosynthetic protein CobC
MLEHGGNLNDAITRFGRDHDDWLDLSTGINPHGYPAPLLSERAWHRLPERSKELADAAAHYYGAPLMLPVAGTQAAIQALPRLRPPSKVAVAGPSYAEHAHHWGQHAHSMRQVPYADLEMAVGECDVVVVCNPNNPTGETVEPERLLAWAERLAVRDGWLIVDEAFADTTPHTSVVRWSDRPGLIVLRSIGKFFGLAGLRLGFVAAQPSLLTRLEDTLGPWTVSGPAQQIGCAALRDRAWQEAMRSRLLTSGRRLHELLRQHGINATGSALYQWWSAAEADAFWQHMAERGILVRLFSQAARGIRLGLPSDEAGWRRLEQAMKQWNNRMKREEMSGER